MATKTKGHTGFRNGDLFCFNCGTSQKLPLPVAIDLAAEWVKGFEKVHSNCTKTWVEPAAEPKEDMSAETVVKNANWWLGNGRHGISSKTMFKYLGKPYGLAIMTDWEMPPSDPDDFSRCYKLLQAVPQWQHELHRLKAVSPVWAKLVDNWDKLTEMYEQNVREDWKNYKKIGMYEFMKSLGC